MNSNESSGETIKKRGPGRPPNKKQEAKLERLGITSEPTNAGVADGGIHVMEIWYENPAMFKKIFGLFKSYNVLQIEVLFDIDKMYMYALDHHGTVSIMVEIIGSRMNRYYIAEPLYASLDTKCFHNIFKGIGKEYNQIMFVTCRMSQNSKIWMAFKRGGHISKYGIELNAVNDNNREQKRMIFEKIAAGNTYPVSFELSFKELKNKISEFTHISKKLNIEQETISVRLRDGTRKEQTQIKFSCSEPDGKVDNYSPYTDPASMNFVSTFEGTYFAAPVWINHIEPLANSLIGDKVKFQVDEQRDMIFIIELDKDEKAKKAISGTEKCIIKLAARLAFSEDNPISN